MTSPLLATYVLGLRRNLPGPVADEAADGLIETYEHHRASGAGEQQAARAALADFGDLAVVVDAYTRQAPGRLAARWLIVTGPVVGASWALALIAGHAWTWAIPGLVRLAFGVLLLASIALLLAAATSRHSYQRTRLTLLASPVFCVMDATAIVVALAYAPSVGLALLLAVAASAGRLVFGGMTIRRMMVR